MSKKTHDRIGNDEFKRLDEKIEFIKRNSKESTDHLHKSTNFPDLDLPLNLELELTEITRKNGISNSKVDKIRDEIYSKLVMVYQIIFFVVLDFDFKKQSANLASSTEYLDSYIKEKISK